MRNLAEQKRVVVPVIWAFAMAVLFAIFFLVFFWNYFVINASLFGYRTYDFMDVTKEFEYDDIDEGEFMRSVEKGSKILLKEYNPELDELQKNDIFAYYVTENTVNRVVTQIFVSSETDIDGQTIYTSHNIDDMTLNTYTIDSGKLLGKWVAPIPYLGYATFYLTYFSWLSYVSLAVLALIMVGIPVIVAIHRARMKKIGSPFPEGVNVNRLSTENLYIYENIKSFVKSGGMRVEKGYDADLVYIGKYLFGILHCTNGHMYFNINKNFQRYDDHIDRSGYICIPHSAYLEKARKRINSMYRAYFLDTARQVRTAGMVPPRRPAPRITHADIEFQRPRVQGTRR
ncbi:MAG: hypothetical protein BWX72_02000 [Firmicutes bacterium ADurb.Bin080]|jgi:hypothetical protein|nr:hypothetical protein [Clostridiales bacterium]OQC12350.1 MAG: hypothetical protein BWX72_02000 [Firmicutes bacterium ADurb.Bin080]